MPYSHDKLLALINARNETEFTDTDLSLSLPTANADSTINRNTQVTVTAQALSGKVGKRTFYYDRLDLAKAHGGKDIRVKIPTPLESYVDILPYVNAHFGLTLELVDLDGSPMDGVYNNDRRTVHLTAHADSYLWTGELEIVLWVFPES